jgi:hypothetical protein
LGPLLQAYHRRRAPISSDRLSAHRSDDERIEAGLLMQRAAGDTAQSLTALVMLGMSGDLAVSEIRPPVYAWDWLPAAR